MIATVMWIPLTLAAAFLQNLRSMLQKRLTGALSVHGAAYLRFCYAAPFVWAYLTILSWQPGLPATSPGFWGYCLLASLAQIVATALLLQTFTLRSFAVGTALSKTEAVQTAVIGLVVLGDHLTPLASLGIAISLVGVLLLNGAGNLGHLLRDRRALALGLLSGTAFAVAAVGFRGAALALPEGTTLLRAAFTLAVAVVVQSTAMGVWLRIREPGQLTRVARAWRVGVWVGLCGAAASVGWFTAMTLQTSALVRALGQVELLFSLATSGWVLRERIRRREIAGILALLLGIYLLL